MTLRHMKIYLAVYQKENITRAAEMLCLSQPAVTRAIQEIEDYYGVCLFERINRRLHVTEAGKLFYGYAVHIIDSFDQMENELRNWDELGMLRVGATITLGNALLPGVLSEFKREHPALQIRASISNGASLHQALLNNQLDFAVVEGGIDDEDLSRELLASDRLVLVLPPDDPRSGREDLKLEELARDAFVIRERGSMGRSLIDDVFAAHGITVVPAIESVSTRAILQAVHQGLGISLLPEALARTALETGFVSTAVIAEEKFKRENYIVWHRHKFLTRSARELMEKFHVMSYGGSERKNP